MRLRYKSLLIMGVVLLVLFSIVLFAGLSLITAQMVKNQSESDQFRAQGIRNNLDIEVEAMIYGVREYSWWGATEQFIQGTNPTFFDMELNMSSLVNMNIDLVVVLSLNGTVLRAESYDAVNDIIVYDAMGMDVLLRPGTRLLTRALQDDPVAGAQWLNGTPYLLSISSIKGDLFTSPPLGVMVFGRAIDSLELESLSKRSGCDVFIYDYGEPASVMGNAVPWESVFSGRGNVTSRSFDGSTSSGLLLQTDLENDRSLVFEARGPNTFIKIGEQSQALLTAAVVLVASVFLLVMFTIMDRQVLRRITVMRNQMKSIGEEVHSNGGSPRSIAYEGDDEFRDMAESANYMLQKIAESEALIAESEHRYRSVVQDQTDFIIRVDLDLNITFVNKALQDCLGEELVYSGGSLAKIVPGDGLDSMRGDMERIVENGGCFEYDGSLESVLHGKRMVHWVVSGILDQGIVTEVQAVGRDITEQRRLQEDLFDAQKMEAMGRLAGGVAHDFNNMFTSILGSMELLHRKVQGDQDAEAELLRLERSIHKAAQVSRNLLIFSRGGTVERKRLGTRRFIGEAADISMLGTQTIFEVDVQEGIDDIEVDPGQMFQALNNLVFNAQQAMDHKGRLRISADNAPPPPGKEGRWVRLAVSDEGPGMTDEVKAHLFKPSFSTKDEGNGIGLVIVKEIMEAHGGQVSYATRLGGGTTFELLLPSLPAAAEDVAEVEGSVLGGPLRVLVMDDEPDLREVTSELLRAEGLEVDTAEDGQQALDRYFEAAQAGDPFQVVIMDLTVRGGMGGMEATRLLLERDPKALVIMSSGYSDAFQSSSSPKGGFAASMPKPYDIQDMVRLIRQVAAAPR